MSRSHLRWVGKRRNRRQSPKSWHGSGEERQRNAKEKYI
jgi:hypothetical protein